LDVPAEQLFDLEIEEVAPSATSHPGAPESVVICTVARGQRAVFALEGVSAYELRLAVAPIVAGIEARSRGAAENAE
jgi:hypothetical protein